MALPGGHVRSYEYDPRSMPQAEDKDTGLGVSCRVIRENALPLLFPCATSSVGRLKSNQMHVCSI